MLIPQGGSEESTPPQGGTKPSLRVRSSRSLVRNMGSTSAVKRHGKLQSVAYRRREAMSNAVAKAPKFLA